LLKKYQRRISLKMAAPTADIFKMAARTAGIFEDGRPFLTATLHGESNHISQI
jgi:hypothetical protein